MKFVIFGAGGFLGKALTNYLKAENHTVWPVLRTHAVDRLTLDITSFNDFDKLNNIDPDIIVNCASALPDAKSLADPAKLLNFYNTNVVGGANITNWAASKGIGKIINCSSLAVINKPWPVPLTEQANTYPGGVHTAYGSSKLSQELVMSQIALQNNINIIHLRLSALYGPGMKWEGILAKLITDMSNSRPINLTHANNVYFNFLHVNDAAKLILKIAGTPGFNSGVYNTASDEEISLFKLASIIKETTNSSSAITLTDTENLVSGANIDISKLLYMLNDAAFKFTPINAGIQEIVNEYKT